MIKSMTGFGRAEASDSDRKITIEMKSVNHRYFEPAMKMPKKLNIYEAGIRTILKKYINRGKVDIFVTYEDYSESKFCLKYNEELANEYMSVFNYMAEQFDIPNDITVSSLSHYPEVITMEEQSGDDDAVWHLLEKLDYMTGLVDEIENRSPGIIEEYRQRLEDKVAELLCDTPVDENRIATEVTIYADKICVDEETVRLRSHIESTKDELIEGGSVGRKLDFIAQEMNREANTILSKANDLETSNCAISLKTEIEKVREQIQNIE